MLSKQTERVSKQDEQEAFPCPGACRMDLVYLEKGCKGVPYSGAKGSRQVCVARLFELVPFVGLVERETKRSTRIWRVFEFEGPPILTHTRYIFHFDPFCFRPPRIFQIPPPEKKTVAPKKGGDSVGPEGPIWVGPVSFRRFRRFRLLPEKTNGEPNPLREARAGGGENPANNTPNKKRPGGSRSSGVFFFFLLLLGDTRAEGWRSPRQVEGEQPSGEDPKSRVLTYEARLSIASHRSVGSGAWSNGLAGFRVSERHEVGRVFRSFFG